MAQYHQLSIIGFLARDPESRYTPSGTMVLNMSIPVTRKWKKDGEPQEETTWFRVAVFGKTAEACNEYLHKGSQVFVQGRIRPGEGGGPTVFQKKDGGWGASYEVVADSVLFLDRKGSGPSGDGGEDHPGGPAVPPPGQTEDETEIPF